MNSEERMIQKLEERVRDIDRRLEVIARRPLEYVRGEALAAGLLRGFDHLTRPVDYWQGRTPVYVVAVPRMLSDFDSIIANVDADDVAYDNVAIRVAFVADEPWAPPGVPDSGPRRKRPCFHDEKGRWIAWMRKDMPPGEVHPDVAVYYEARGISTGPWEKDDPAGEHLAACNALNEAVRTASMRASANAADAARLASVIATLTAQVDALRKALEGVALREKDDGPCFCSIVAGPHHMRCVYARGVLEDTQQGGK